MGHFDGGCGLIADNDLSGRRWDRNPGRGEEMGKGWWIVLLLTGVAAANAASFNCAQAVTPQERAICASPELSAADDRMAGAYRDLLAAAPAGMRPELRDGQREWLRELAEKCRDGEPSSDLSSCL